MVSQWFQGDLVLCDFNPSVGHEPQKQRPALIVSNNQFNSNSSLVMVCPITSTDNGYPLHIEVGANVSGVSGFICLEQIRALDLNARNAITIGQVTAETLLRVVHLLTLSIEIVG